MDIQYLVIPFLSWFIAGVTKFLVNSARTRTLAFDQIGYGGMPSNHSAIVSGTTVLIALREGIAHPAFGVALCFSFIVMLDAVSLRRQIGRQAQAINSIRATSEPLRERMGHSPAEILGGIAVGILSAVLTYQLLAI